MMAARASASAPERVRINIVQGEAKVDDRPEVVLTTLLGSCVSACIRDAGAGVGGMNHFLLPGEASAAGGRVESYGLYLMEVLINGLLKRGARRHALEAKLFGGARTMDGLSDIGAKNADFARRFLAMEGIAYAGGSVGGLVGRRIEYWPVSGRARQVLMEQTDRRAFALPVQPAQPADTLGDLELF